MKELEFQGRKVVLTAHALRRMKERGTCEEAVLEALRIGQPEPTRRGRTLYRLNLEFGRKWDNKYYAIQQVAPVTVEEDDKIIIVTVYTFYFQEERRHEDHVR
jgi:hypothetical protein